MNLIDKLAHEKFAGNYYLTAQYIFTEIPKDMQMQYLDDITTEQANVFQKYMDDVLTRNGTMDKMLNAAKEEHSLRFINLTKDEVTKMEVNPFKAQIINSVVKFLILSGSLGAVVLLNSTFNLGSFGTSLQTFMTSASTLVTGLLSAKTAKDIMSYFKFKNLKKKYEMQNVNEQEILVDKGRDM